MNRRRRNRHPYWLRLLWTWIEEERIEEHKFYQGEPETKESVD
jgi:hypothetical protein